MSDNIWAIGDTLMLINSKEPWFTKFNKLRCISKSNQLDSSNMTQSLLTNNEKFENITNYPNVSKILNKSSNKRSLLMIILIILLVIVISI